MNPYRPLFQETPAMRDPQSIKIFNVDSLTHEVVKCSDSDPPLSREGWFRVTAKCTMTIDVHPTDLDDPLRFGTELIPISCIACRLSPS